MDKKKFRIRRWIVRQLTLLAYHIETPVWEYDYNNRPNKDIMGCRCEP